MQVQIYSWRYLIFQFTVCEVYKTPARPTAVNQKRFAGKILKSVTNVHVCYLNKKNRAFFFFVLSVKALIALHSKRFAWWHAAKPLLCNFTLSRGPGGFAHRRAVSLAFQLAVFKYGAGNIWFLFVDTHRIWRTRCFCTSKFCKLSESTERDDGLFFIYYFP